MQIQVKALTGNIITLQVDIITSIAEILGMVQRAAVLTPQQTAAINILSTGVVHGGLRLVSQDTGLEHHPDESCDVAALLDGKRCKVVLKKQFNDALRPDDVAIVKMPQDEYKAGV